jgi:hypothetical protein
MRGSTIALLLALGSAGALLAYVRQPPRPPPADWRSAWAERNRAADGTPTMTTFMVPGPGGAEVRVRFYGLDRLPQVSDEALCKLLGDARPSTAAGNEQAADEETRKDRAELEAETRTALGIVCDASRPAALRLEAVGVAIHGLVASGADPTIHRIPIKAGAEARLLVAAMREARSWRDVVRVGSNGGLFAYVGEGLTGLWFRRLASDIDRITAVMCAAYAAKDCAAPLLVSAARTYAEIGRQTDDEQHFNDAGDALREAEAMLQPLKDAPENHQQFRTIASAYGYAGEAGRREAFVRKAAELSAEVVVALEHGKEGEKAHEYSRAISVLAANLGRLAAYETDKRGALERALSVNVIAIAHDERHSPGHPFWTNHANLSTTSTELFAISREDRVIEDAIMHGRRAAAIVDRSISQGAADAHDRAYVRMRLGEALAWKARHGQKLEEPQRRALAQEAKALFDEAEPVFVDYNTQAYLRSLHRSRPLVDEVLQNSPR